jgi:hypothetical protein
MATAVYINADYVLTYSDVLAKTENCKTILHFYFFTLWSSVKVQPFSGSFSICSEIVVLGGTSTECYRFQHFFFSTKVVRSCPRIPLIVCNYISS